MKCIRCSRAFETCAQARPWSLSENPSVAYVSLEPTETETQWGLAWEPSRKECLHEGFRRSQVDLRRVLWISFVRCSGNGRDQVQSEEIDACVVNFRKSLSAYGVRCVVLIDCQPHAERIATLLPDIEVFAVQSDDEVGLMRVARDVKRYQLKVRAEVVQNGKS